MVAPTPRRRKPIPSETSLDFNDGRTSNLERWIVWIILVCTVLGVVSETYQALHAAGVL